MAHFGPGIPTASGEINRREPARRIFADPEARLVLNRLTHPRVVARTAVILRRLARREPQAVAVIDAPLLLEVGMDRLVDEVWVVKCPKKRRRSGS